MIAVDTNVLVRLLTADDPNQYQHAYKLFQRADVFIPTTVALEAEWVLRYAYDFGRDDIVEALRNLFGLSNVEVEEPQRIAKALEWHKAGMDFADALHLAASANCEEFVTFDRQLINMAKKITELTVSQP
ncbi:MAG: type II toxin-antitoxin system VapC family toxin [Chloroflexota bacterium]|jgi:predicted nucleic-acid-binding protein